MTKIARRRERISAHPGIMGGKPWIGGTRDSRGVPGLAVEDVWAAAAFAADVMADEAVVLEDA